MTFEDALTGNIAHARVSFGSNRPGGRRFSYEEGRKVRAPMDKVLGNAQGFGILQRFQNTDSGTETYRL